MTSHGLLVVWEVLCAIHFADDLVVLWPKCSQVDCMDPVDSLVHWPSGSVQCCAHHTAPWRKGVNLRVDPVHYQRGNRDDAEQRFAMMELE